jgi:hypothetical protein
LPEESNYDQIIAHVFAMNYVAGAVDIAFPRSAIAVGAEELGLPRPGNIGDVLYSFRYRRPLPASVNEKAPPGKQWVIRGAGKSQYRFCAVQGNVWIEPHANLVVTKVPDATPEIIGANAFSDEQALLALLRYNRLIDIFLGVTAYSLQNHLRTTVSGVGQVEVDEVYLAVDRYGVQYVLPVQAKGGTDILGRIQVEQDIAMCEAKFPQLVMRPIAAQFMPSGTIALFEVAIHENAMVVVREAHYKLVPFDEITPEDRKLFRSQAGLPPLPPTASA